MVKENPWATSEKWGTELAEIMSDFCTKNNISGIETFGFITTIFITKALTSGFSEKTFKKTLDLMAITFNEEKRKDT